MTRSHRPFPARPAPADERQHRTVHRAFTQDVRLPAAASVIDEPVTVVEVLYEGNPRRGLTARCRTAAGREHVLALADVRFPEGSEAARHVARYRAWLGLTRDPDQADSGREGDDRPAADIDRSRPVELVVLSLTDSAGRCHLLGTDRLITVRGGYLGGAVPGEIITVRPRRHWRYARHEYLAGDVTGRRLDVTALGLVPLRVEPFGTWDPAEEYWGEDGDVIESWAQAIIDRGPRPEFEMEQVLPGTDPDDPDSDPITGAIDLRDAGDPAGARRMLMKLLDDDLRCLDAHVHLGNWAFDHSPGDALRHYEVAVRIGEMSLGGDFDGVLRWGMIDNRPFLRALHGYGLCVWRLERWDEAERVFDRMLWMSPSDNQGVRFLLPAVRARQRWEDEWGTDGASDGAR